MWCRRRRLRRLQRRRHRVLATELPRHHRCESATETGIVRRTQIETGIAGEIEIETEIETGTIVVVIEIEIEIEIDRMAAIVIEIVIVIVIVIDRMAVIVSAIVNVNEIEIVSVSVSVIERARRQSEAVGASQTMARHNWTSSVA